MERWGRQAAALLVGAVLLSGCYRVADVRPDQFVRLSGHRPGRPPVRVRTLDGTAVDVEGGFKEARIVTRDDNETTLRPPFLARTDGTWLRYRSAETTGGVDPDRVARVEIVQRDGSRTLTVIVATSAAAVAGFFAGALAAKLEQNAGYEPCVGCQVVGGAVGMGGMTALIVVPLTAHY